MKRGLMVAAALLILALASPALALTQDEAQQLVSATGCTAPVTYVESPYNDGFNAFYSPMYNRIVGINFSRLPDSWQRMIMLHEAGHCLGIDNEWDADKFAIRQLAEYGIDGSEVSQEIWASLYRQYEIVGDANEEHGLVVERSVRSRLNRVVLKVEAA